MQPSYGQQPQWAQGQIATGESRSIDSYVNELLAQISTVTSSGGGAAGDYTVSVEGPDGETASATYTSPGTETDTDIATGVAAAIEADEDFANIASATSSAAVVTLTFLHEGRTYAITTEWAAGSGTAADTTDAGGTDIGLGLAVQDGSSDGLCLVLDGGTVDADLLGLTCQSVDGLINGLDGEDTAFGPGKTVSVMRQGPVVAPVEDAVTKGGDVYVRIANATASKPLGGCRSDADGGDAIQMTDAKFGSTTTGSGLAVVRLNRT